MDIEVAIEQVQRVIQYVEEVKSEHEAYQEDPDGELPECLYDIDVYCDGGYCNLDDAAETLVSALDLLIELKRLSPRQSGNFDNYGRLQR